ncbi:hypothetical protein [Marinifilum flexuosum]|uniref:Tail assembly chaperone n=1 Tax=Marinifilum flexuosum TaxID=1117708 RepID=A0A419WMT5_9BACT|nr:hypothetical protein [Marinifilum flexuosum]RKD96785.1 hypothetical protein BXY64_3732 [Marinifilum flexuosum]
MKVKLDNKEYSVAFGMSAFRNLKNRVGIDIPDVQKCLKKMMDKPDDVDMQQMETIAELILSGIINGARKEKLDDPGLTIDDVFDIMDDTAQFEKIMEEYSKDADTGEKN